MGNKSSSQVNDSYQSDNSKSTGNSSSSRNVSIRTTSSENSTRTKETQASKPSYYQMAKQGYQELVNAIIRPPRCLYTVQQLGPIEFDFCGRRVERIDFELTNPRGLNIQCSMWQPTHECRPNPILPCVIYMHGNSSSRLEALPQLSLVLSLGATLFSFDFTGSGLSDGEYVSLGAFEKDDLQCVIQYLRDSGKTSTIALWGRSMGAATSLMHGGRDPSIAGMILDSTFADLEMLAKELVDKGRQHGLYAPGIVVSIAISFIRSSVHKSAGFDIKDLSPIAHAEKCFIPALFVTADNDTFIPPHHSEKIFELYAGDKNLITVEGDHNSLRPRFMQDSATIFLQNALQIPDDWILEEGQQYIGYYPWSSSTSNIYSKSSRHVTKAASIITHDDTDEMEIGMTRERQAQIQSHLFQMMGNTSKTRSDYIQSPSALRSSEHENSDSEDKLIATSTSSKRTMTQRNLRTKSSGSADELKAVVGSGSRRSHSEVGISEKILASNKSTTLIPINDELVYSNEDQMDNTDAELELALQLSLSTYQRESTGQTNETVVSISHTETQYKQHGENTIVSEEWECPTCTLMNTAENASDCCLACGLPRYS